ncbi:MAG: SGNH/GDSL hydrolase family protein [Bacteroidota bacterium]
MKTQILMNTRLRLFFFLTFLQCTLVYSQEIPYVWWNPAKNLFPVMEGQAWKEVQNPYDRLPAKAEKIVRADVWNLSHHSAGLMLRFKSNADQILVRYKVKGQLAMLHMPATGVSGVDLYAVSTDGKWLWCAGKYSMGDTIEYRFKGLEPNDSYHQKGREYRLYFPLYNSVQWIEIGVPNGTLFNPLPTRKEKPIVVYGTSIAQGGCASRPGMAWSAIVGRKLDRPLINLGFSGNGRLEKEVIDLMGEIDAKLYVLDCLPNLDASDVSKSEQVKNLVIQSVRQLRQKGPTPILLVEHCGYSDEAVNPINRSDYITLNQAQRKAFEQLKSEGHNNLYLISKEEIGLTIDGTVDGIHPNDLGMQDYANAFEEIIREILNEPYGKLATTQPCIQNRDANVYDWDNRHQEILSLNKIKPPRIIFLGNSITHFWGGEPKTSVVNGIDSWNQYMEPTGVRNFGYGWDRIENVLWRVYHDELSGFEAAQVIILIGTNNISINSNLEILEGLQFLIQAIKIRQPKAEILVLGIYPRRIDEEKITELNQGIVNVSGLMNIRYLDAGKVLLGTNGKIEEALFTDGLHPNAEGYRKLAEFMSPYLKADTKSLQKTKK